ncbi:MAG: HAD family hydrolase [Desulfobulbaceae bacterium]|nr:HAD family hydrolase [Desulfobulbaceae bacterium]
MTKKNPLQAIFFDFDGVLVNSNPIKTEAFRTLFRKYNEEIVAEIVAHHQQHCGISRVEKIRYVHQYIIRQPLTEEVVADRAAEYSKLVLEKVIEAGWIDGAKEFLDNFPGALPIFVISGTPETELREIIDRRKMSAYFGEILGSPIKKPVHIRNLLSDYQLVPDRCVFVGDALTDYAAARETGLQFIGIHGDVEFPSGTTVLPDCRGLQREIAACFNW